MSPRVRISDVAPRDGLQNESRIIPTADKVQLVKLIAAAGVDEVEVSSFVSPKWVPQLADAAEVFAALREHKPRECVFSALVPNEKGMTAALSVNRAAAPCSSQTPPPEHVAADPRVGRAQSGDISTLPLPRPGTEGSTAPLIDKVAVFTAASETFAQRNTNATIAETLERFRPVVALAHQNGLSVRAYVSCAIACPFEGPIRPARVADVAARLAELGVDEIDLADTIGAGTPNTVREMTQCVLAQLGDVWLPKLTLHLHDTFGAAAACLGPALELGLRSFDGAAGGLGGCPYASTPDRRAPGNLSTERLLEAVQALGFTTRVERDRLAEAAAYARGLIVPNGARSAEPACHRAGPGRGTTRL
jgi:hydroxymethylglutaryl-CoA lyase